MCKTIQLTGISTFIIIIKPTIVKRRRPCLGWSTVLVAALGSVMGKHREGDPV